MILNIAGNAQYKAAMSRATAEIKQMETACESYKVDNGTYPRDNGTTNYTDTLNAQQNSDPTVTLYTNASTYLFQQLSGNTQFATGSGTTAASKIYITFLPNQLMNSDGTAVSAVLNKSTYLADPFGFSYGYSTANQLAQDTANSTNPPGTVDSSKGYNPTFDLWSTGGYSPSGGKSYPTTVTSATYNTLWAKNW